MKTILSLIAVVSFWSVALAQMPLLAERHTNQMAADIAASDVVAIVVVKSVTPIESTNNAGQKTITYTLTMKLESTLKGSLPTEFLVTFQTNLTRMIEGYYPQMADFVPKRSVCFLKYDGKGYTAAIGGYSLRPLLGSSGRFDWRTKYPSVGELESIAKLSLARK